MFGCETPPFLLVGGSSFVRSVKIVGFGNLELRSNERERERERNKMVGGSKSYAVGSWGLSNVFVCVQ